MVDVAVASSVRGGVIRQNPFGSQYRDPFTGSSYNYSPVGGGGGRSPQAPIDNSTAEAARLAQEAQARLEAEQAAQRAAEAARLAQIRQQEILARQNLINNVAPSSNESIIETPYGKHTIIDRFAPKTSTSTSQPQVTSKDLNPEYNPPLVESVALTPKQQLAQLIAKEGYVKGTKEFLVEKAQGRLTKLEQDLGINRGQSVFNTRIGSSETSGFSAAAQSAPYFIPIVGPVILTAEGVEAALNKNLTTSERLLGAGQAVLGGVSTVYSAGEALGFPKLTTNFLNQVINRVDNVVESRGGAVTNVRGLLTERKYISAFESKSGFNAANEDVQAFQSLSRGAVRPFKGTDLVTGERLYGANRPFVSGSSGIVVPKDLKIGIDLQGQLEGTRIAKELPGFQTSSVSRTFTGPNEFIRDVTKIKEATPTTRFNVGLGAEVDDKIVSQSASFPLKEAKNELGFTFAKAGKGTSRGITVNKEAEQIDNIVNQGSPTLKKLFSLPRTAIQEDLAKTAIEDAVRADVLARNQAVKVTTRTGARTIATARPEKSYPTIVGGQGAESQFYNKAYQQPTNTVQNLANNLDVAVRTPSATTPKYAQPTRTRQRTIQDLVQPQPQTQPSLTSQALRLQLRQQEKLVEQTINPDIVGFGDGFGFPPLIYPRIGKKRIYRKGQSLGYTVSIKKGKSYIPIAQGLPRGRALAVGADKILKDLARTFKVTQSGTTDIEDISFFPSEKEFRQYQVRKGRQKPLPIDTFIQRTRTLLKSPEEKYLLQATRRR